ncbi:tail terminator [Gordonia phage LittleFella]|nr:tail terminator [Gordonia phage LittleFella]
MSCGGIVTALSAQLDVPVFPDYTMETVPRDDGPFLILRWGNQNVTPAVRRGPHTLTVWAHEPIEYTTDYTEIVNLLRSAQAVLEGNISTGADGVVVTDVAFQGDSGNLIDPGFRTITRNSTYRVLLA